MRHRSLRARPPKSMGVPTAIEMTITSDFKTRGCQRSVRFDTGHSGNLAFGQPVAVKGGSIKVVMVFRRESVVAIVVLLLLVPPLMMKLIMKWNTEYNGIFLSFWKTLA